jgi:hypothetical protein
LPNAGRGHRRLVQQGNNWFLAGKGRYPSDFGTVRSGASSASLRGKTKVTYLLGYCADSASNKCRATRRRCSISAGVTILANICVSDRDQDRRDHEDAGCQHQHINHVIASEEIQLQHRYPHGTRHLWTISTGTMTRIMNLEPWRVAAKRQPHEANPQGADTDLRPYAFVQF